MKRWLTALAIGLVATAATAGAARADGLPVVGIEAGPAGVPAEDGDVRYVTLRAGDGTLLAKIAQTGGEVIRSAFLPGRFSVPVVAFDGSTAGLSNDGRTLVLVRPRVAFPQGRTAFAVFDANRLRRPQRITLDGDFSFDALSPNGRLLYLIEYVEPQDPTRYRVRVLDVDRGRLLPGKIVDPREPDEAMRGFPITRETTADGRWAYTLYDGAGGNPFVHALDTTGRTAACIDLDALTGRNDLYDLRLALAPDERTLELRTGDEPLAVIDTTTFAVSEPEAAPSAPAPAVTQPMRSASAAREERGSGTSPWWPFVAAVGGGALAAAVAAGALVVRRRKAGLAGGPEPYAFERRPNTRPPRANPRPNVPSTKPPIANALRQVESRSQRPRASRSSGESDSPRRRLRPAAPARRPRYMSSKTSADSSAIVFTIETGFAAPKFAQEPPYSCRKRNTRKTCWSSRPRRARGTSASIARRASLGRE
jgi:hypothetical protein